MGVFFRMEWFHKLHFIARKTRGSCYGSSPLMSVSLLAHDLYEQGWVRGICGMYEVEFLKEIIFWHMCMS